MSSSTFVSGDEKNYDGKRQITSYLNQQCFCGIIHDYAFKGRIIQCPGCGYQLKEDPNHKHRLIRVG